MFLRLLVNLTLPRVSFQNRSILHFKVAEELFPELTQRSVDIKMKISYGDTDPTNTHINNSQS